MAAVTVALRTYLRTIIGLGNDVEGLERADAIIGKGIDSTDDLADLYDEKGIKTLCANIQKPGGTIPDPNYARAGPAPRIPKLGQTIPTACENRLDSAAYGGMLYISIGRGVGTANLSRA